MSVILFVIIAVLTAVAGEVIRKQIQRLLS